MKTWKFTLSFLAASIMANSPLAWAATDLNQKKAYNKFLKEQVMASGATMNSLYQKKKQYFDSPSKAWIEAWLQNFGKESTPTVDTQTVKDKNGNETIKLILSKAGSTVTVVLNSQDREHVTINGQKFHYLEAMNITTVVNRLAETDSAYKALALEMNSQKPPARANGSTGDQLTTQQFMKLSPIKKVEYMQLWRGVIETAQNVNVNRYGAQNETESKNYANLHPMFSSMLAWAAGRPKDGTSCLVAGNVNAYKNGSCKFDAKDPFNKMCVAKGLGDVACNPLVYGMAVAGPNAGSPLCLKSTDQPSFTQRATSTCNLISPITGAEGSKERNDNYKRILTSYLLGKGADAKTFENCFNSQSEIDPKCKGLFDQQLQDFKKLKEQTELLCQAVSLPDQKEACNAFKERTLDLMEFSASTGNPDPAPAPQPDPAPTITSTTLINQAQAECEKDSAKKWNMATGECELIPVTTVPQPKPSKPAKEKKDRFVLGLAIGAGVMALAWLFLGKTKTVTKTVTNTITVPVPVTTLPPPSEGGSGKGDGNNGGVRGTGGSQ